MRNVVPFILLAMALVSAGMAEDYHGFRIEESAITKASNLAAIRRATQDQIDIVRSVGLPPDVLEFFQTVRFELIPAGTTRVRTPGLYSRRDRTVKVAAGIVVVGHKPVLLHELLHAFHDQRVKDGFDNRDIARFYAQAQKLGAYARSSHMMENAREYFACSATTYLFGVTAQEPFKRDRIRSAQPEFYAFLEAMFGPAAGRYAGSLTH